jgi:hypothetical protein
MTQRATRVKAARTQPPASTINLAVPRGAERRSAERPVAGWVPLRFAQRARGARAPPVI